MRYQRLIGSIPLIFLLLTGCKGGRDRERVIDEVYVHKYGVTVPGKEWNTRGQHGQIITQLDNGVVVKRNFMAGVLEGEATTSYPHSGTVAKCETYVEGRVVAERQNYPSGNPKLEIKFDKDGGKTITSWYHDGTPMTLEQYENDRLVKGEYFSSEHQIVSQVVDGRGMRINRDEYGQLISHDNFEEGMISLQTTFYADGSPKELISYQNGAIEGEKKSFLPSGEPVAVEIWHHGQKDGVATVFQNGRKSAEIPYQNDKKNGVEKRFSEEGEIVEEISWREGRRHGPSYTYIGETTKVEWYKENLRVSENQY